jgi:hypothetical protein
MPVLNLQIVEQSASYLVLGIRSMLLGIRAILKNNIASLHRGSEYGGVAVIMEVTEIMETMGIMEIAGGAAIMKIMGATAMT